MDASWKFPTRKSQSRIPVAVFIYRGIRTSMHAKVHFPARALGAYLGIICHNVEGRRRKKFTTAANGNADAKHRKETSRVHAQVFHRERDARSAARKRALERSAASIIHPPRINSDAVTLIGAPSLILLHACVVGNLLPRCRRITAASISGSVTRACKSP